MVFLFVPIDIDYSCICIWLLLLAHLLDIVGCKPSDVLAQTNSSNQLEYFHIFQWFEWYSNFSCHENIFLKLKSFLAGSDWYISGSTKSNLESVVVSTGFSFVIDVVDIFGVEVVVDVVLDAVEVVVDVDVVVEVVVDVDVDVVVEVVVDELDTSTDRSSAAAVSVVVGMVVVIGSSSEQTVFATAFHLHSSSSNHEKKSLKYHS